MRGDVVSIIEAAYRVELPTRQWLGELGAAFYERLGGGAGLFGCTYRIVDGQRLVIDEELRLEMPDEQSMPMRASMEMMPVDFLRQTFARTDCGTQSQSITPEMRPFLEMAMAPLRARGWNDIMNCSAVDPAGHGIYFGAWLKEPDRLTPALRRRWTRGAVHMAAALRLRRRLAPPAQAEAVLSPSGKLEHAQPAAQLDHARSSLVAAVKAVEKARGKLRQIDPEAASASWKGLVSTRWSLVDHFESDGKRWVLAHRNDVPVDGAAALTDRERQALAFAALGHTNKLIAYELGVAPSTVAVLLHRAAKKLGTANRAELIAAWLKLAKPA
jgi:DNA-binding CsgD family transcriptional regulator